MSSAVDIVLLLGVSLAPIRSIHTPTVRRGWATLPDGRLALAIGDAWIVNDPVTGQGANIGSHCAWHTAEALATPDASTALVRDNLQLQEV